MANPLPEEKEFFERIRNENITINPEIWDLLYNRIGDDLSAINLLCQCYLSEAKPVPILEAKKILNYTHHIKEITNQLTLSSQKGDFPFPEFLDNVPLHTILREMLTHYIGNDVYMINLIVRDSIGPLEPKDISLESTRKILSHSRTIKEFMEKLRTATSREENRFNPQETPKEFLGKDITKEQVFSIIRKCLTQEFDLSEEKIRIDSNFQEDLGFDSIDTIQVIMALEQAFGFEIPDDAAEGVLTVAQAVDYVYRYISLTS